MKVYMVTEGDYEDKFIVGIFTDKEVAEHVLVECQKKSDARRVYQGELVQIVEYELNPDPVELVASYP